MLALTVPRLWQRGMFLDGLTYAAIARNMAQGVGTLWAPSFSSTSYQQFFEQPPLGLAIQALAFAVFGDHFAVERVFSLAMFLANGALIAAIWRRYLPADYDWLPVLFWLLPSVVTWAVINNMLENTQAVFTTFACYALMRSTSEHFQSAAAWAAASALAVVGGTLVKGPVGLFPLALPLLFLVLRPKQRPRHPAVVCVTVGVVVAACSAALAVHDGARNGILAFADSHLAPALAGDRGLDQVGVEIARHLTLGIGLRMAVGVALFWLFTRFRATVTTAREAGFFLAIAGAASLPILMSPVLAGHYFFPSTPFFALAFGALALPASSAGRRQATRMAWVAPYGLAGGLATLALGVLLLNGPLELRNVDMIRSLDAIREVAPEGQTIGACPSSSEDWGLHNYLQRFYRISLDTSDAPVTDWFLVTPGACIAPSPCQAVADTENFALLRCS
jgi:4-amino-4-deoxy-L-arabinose transferase-like glycosyltransferase